MSFVSDVPRQIIVFVTYQEGEMYFTAVLELGDGADVCDGKASLLTVLGSVLGVE